MEPLKEMFNKSYYEGFAKELKRAAPGVSGETFLKDVTHGLKELSLNQRLRKTSLTLKDHLPNDFEKCVAILKSMIPNTRPGYTNLVFPDFVGLFGHEHFEVSMNALKEFTKYGSSEFAIREFLKRDFKRTIHTMNKWAEDKNEHVRRLASEGCRPRLPWSFKLDEVIKNPTLTFPILEKLNQDESKYVRKSVANHLNDISKDHPSEMTLFLKSWDQKHPHSAWIIKHASRTLIKKGNKESLELFDFEKNVKVRLSKFKLEPTTVKLGKTLFFSFEIESDKKQKQKLVIDYIIHYCKKSGATVPKLFKLKEIELKFGHTIIITKKQLIKDFSTRKHYAGKHRLEIQVNGKICIGKDFRLVI